MHSQHLRHPLHHLLQTGNVEDDNHDNDNNYTIDLQSDDDPDNPDPDNNGENTVEGAGVEKGSINSQEGLGKANCISCEHQLISNIVDKLYKTYKSPIYVFYLPPVFKFENKKHYHF